MTGNTISEIAENLSLDLRQLAELLMMEGIDDDDIQEAIDNLETIVEKYQSQLNDAVYDDAIGIYVVERVRA